MTDSSSEILEANGQQNDNFKTLQGKTVKPPAYQAKISCKSEAEIETFRKIKIERIFQQTCHSDLQKEMKSIKIGG